MQTAPEQQPDDFEEILACIQGLEYMIGQWMAKPREGDGALIEKIIQMKELDILLESVKSLGKPAQELYDKLRLFDIPDAMAEEGTSSIKNGKFGRCTITGDLSVSVKDKVKLHKWLEEGGNGALIVPTVNAQTLKAFIKEQMRETGEVPAEDIVLIKPFSRAVIYKS